ncbi:hypothetical protein F4821DRAFT_253759 [Hypoxylon rubiginosum]|uniref:Uncharacterized protein n=1 Tax=Hypoxylon rubiginosum TaxID=110542 RepID=A0ACC0DJQ5_9PEZI|nr:hypothetical protein F4821DRAFT_253759 [Hypoxylon rubiginosum]
MAWHWLIARKSWNLDPILSWALIRNREVFMAALCNAWLSGMVMTVTIVQIPQRFMIVDRLSPIDSGVRLLPFAAVMVSTSVLVTVAIAKFKVFAVTSLILGALLEIAVVAGFSRASTHVGIEPSQYVFQILAGVCVGICNIILLLLTPHLVEKEDLAVGNGAINQIRILGGSLGLSIVTVATTPTLQANLVKVIGPEQTARVLDRTNQIQILSLPSETQAVIIESFGTLYNTQMAILIGISAAQVVASMLQWQRKEIILKK